MSGASYTDSKGRLRWHRNEAIAARIKQLGEFLIIGGYPESHALRYGQIAHTISRWPESLDTLAAEQRLGSIPGVGGVIADYLGEIVHTGTSSKFDDDQYGTPPPMSVLELTAIPGVGAKTARMLYRELGIDGLSALRRALQEKRLDGQKGIGPKMRETLARYCVEQSGETPQS